MTRDQVIERVVEGKGEASREARRAAFANSGVTPEPVRALIEKVARQAWKISDEDIAAAKAAGLGEDQIFELVIAAALGAAKRQHDAALAALAEVK
jgi:hypothetical protein